MLLSVLDAFLEVFIEDLFDLELFSHNDRRLVYFAGPSECAYTVGKSMRF